MTTYIITSAQLESVRAQRLQLLDGPNKNDHAAAARLDWTLSLQPVCEADEVLVALRRGDGYEDVRPQLVSEDAIGDRWPEYRTITEA